MCPTDGGRPQLPLLLTTENADGAVVPTTTSQGHHITYSWPKTCARSGGEVKALMRCLLNTVPNLVSQKSCASLNYWIIITNHFSQRPVS